MKLSIYANLLKLLFDSEIELGINGLTECDRLILLEVIDVANSSEKQEFKLKYDQVVESLVSNGSGSVSKQQFFNSLKKFESLGLLQKVGTVRSSSYVLSK